MRAAISMLPIAFTGNNGPVRRADQTGDNEGVPVTEFRIVMDRLLRDHGHADDRRPRARRARSRRRRTGVAVVNETLAKRLFPTLDPAAVVGQRDPDRIGSTARPTRSSAWPRTCDRGGPTRRPILRCMCRSHQNPSPSMSYVVRAARRSGGAQRIRFARRWRR